ncbi:hypothetical protein [Thermococcus sp. 21S7]|uniref:hypothetical protein n=1 Tax=Thermococcus sp. 21S7 TaxID=1638221 RepID=UPI00143C28E9|nr:hypothetical protein [Thermococcus sp. 21S7]
METKLKAKPGQKRGASPRPKAITGHGKRKGGRGFKVFGEEKVKAIYEKVKLVRAWRS